MKINNILAYLVFMWFSSATAYCQASSFASGKYLSDSGPYITGELFAPPVPVNPATFFNENWLPGVVFLTDGGIIRDKRIRYNGLLDELFCQDDKSNKTIKIDKEQISQFHFQSINGDTAVYFRKIMVKRNFVADSNEIFAEEIYNGNLSLFIFHKYTFERTELVSTEGGSFLKDIYKEHPVYYLRDSKKRSAGIKKLNVKGLSYIIPGKEDLIIQFFRQANRKEFITKPELIILCQFLNSIN